MTDRMVELPAETAEALTRYALDMLYIADQEGGCCPDCCAPCDALRELEKTGQLDDLVRGYASNADVDWWDTEHDRVDRGFLSRAWRLTGCGETHG